MNVTETHTINGIWLGCAYMLYCMCTCTCERDGAYLEIDTLEAVAGGKLRMGSSGSSAFTAPVSRQNELSCIHALPPTLLSL